MLKQSLLIGCLVAAFSLPLLAGQESSIDPSSTPSRGPGISLRVPATTAAIARAEAQGSGRAGGQGQGQGQGQGTQGQGQRPLTRDDEFDIELEAALKFRKMMQGGPTCGPGAGGKVNKPVTKKGGGTTTSKDATGLFPRQDAGSSGVVVIYMTGEAEFINCSSYLVQAYMGGAEVELAPRANGMAPFIAVAAGLERSFGSSAFAFQPSAGVKIPFDRFKVRVSVDYRRSAYDGVSDNGIGFGAGIIFPLKR
jgi:hypothetical protein